MRHAGWWWWPWDDHPLQPQAEREARDGHERLREARRLRAAAGEVAARHREIEQRNHLAEGMAAALAGRRREGS